MRSSNETFIGIQGKACSNKYCLRFLKLERQKDIFSQQGIPCLKNSTGLWASPQVIGSNQHKLFIFYMKIAGGTSCMYFFHLPGHVLLFVISRVLNGSFLMYQHHMFLELMMPQVHYHHSYLFCNHATLNVPSCVFASLWFDYMNLRAF